jgi:ATP-binding cassette, subfamily B, heavy metal transporter
MLIQLLFVSYGVAWILNQVVQQLGFICIIGALERGMRMLNLHIFEHIQSLSMRFHLDKKTGSITNAIDRTQSGFDAIFWALFLFIIPTIIEMTVISIIFVRLYGIDYSFILLCTAICYCIFCRYAITVVDTIQEEYNQKKSLASETFVDSLLNIETVKYFNNQRYDYEKCDRILQQQEKVGVKLHSFGVLFYCGQKVIIGIGLMLLTVKSGNAVLAKTMSIGDFILINSYLLQFTAPLSSFGYVFRQIKKGLTDMGDIMKLFEIVPEVCDTQHAHVINPAKADVTFNMVNFGYTHERTVLKNISLHIPSGKTVAIVGSTGSGKSTITKLLFRFYDVSSGAIFFNDHDIRTITQQSLHKAIGVVSQDTSLFNDTLYYNIAYANSAATKYDVERAIELAHLTELITRLPDGYNTIVGQRGLKLSGGEKQRVAIARVLLKNPALYIFDEATSSLDNSTERLLQQNLKTIAQGKTTLIIAHRLSTIVHADEIIVLDNGIIVERGDHAQLLECGGMYYKLWNSQTRAAE